MRSKSSLACSAAARAATSRNESGVERVGVFSKISFREGMK